MKAKRVKSKDPKDGVHFDITHEDGRTTPVQVSSLNWEQAAARLGFPGDFARYAEHMALNQARANFAAQDRQKAQNGVVRNPDGSVAKPRSAKRAAKTAAKKSARRRGSK